MNLALTLLASFARAEVDAPASKGFTVSDYAKAYQGAPKTLP